MIDVRLFETNNGGDLQLNGNSFLEAVSFENMPYLAMFGGNPGHVTKREKREEEQQFDWWGNKTLMDEVPEMQFNSRTEYALNNEPLNSNGRKRIQEAVKADLKFMEKFADVSVNVTILGFHKVSIGISLVQPDNQDEREFIYIWDGALLIDDKVKVNPKPIQPEGLEEILEFELG